MKHHFSLAVIFMMTVGFTLTTAIPLTFAYSSKEAKGKVEASEKALGEAQAAKAREKKAEDDWVKKRGQAFQDQVDANKKEEEARAAREKANQTGKQEDVKAAEKAEKIAKNAQDKADESEKVLGEVTQALEEAKAAAAQAKEKAAGTIAPAEEAVGSLPQSSVKDKLKERIKKVKEGLNQLALAPLPRGTIETASAELSESVDFVKLDSQKVSHSIVGTKETIGHVATLTVTNHTKEPISFHILPTILKSKTGRVQNYALTNPMEVTLGPKETRAIPLTGVCLDARVPPAGPEDKDELSILDPATPDFEQTWGPLLAGTQTVIQTTQELQKQGGYKTPYSKSPRKELDTIVQWTTWAFVSHLQGNPITKQDLAKKVYEQTGKEVMPEQKEKLDEGIDDIWKSVQLTGIKAKLLPSETEKISDTEKGKGIAEDTEPETKPEESQEEVLKRLGWTKDEKGRWRPPTKPEPPKPPRWEEVLDQNTGRRGIRSPEGKTIYEGEEGYDKAQEELKKQQEADQKKKDEEELKRQETEKEKAQKDAKDRDAKEKRQREKENYEKRKNGDINAWNEWLQGNPGRQKVEIKKQDGSGTGRYNYFDESGKIVAENMPG